jgi:hypothetical protein
MDAVLSILAAGGAWILTADLDLFQAPCRLRRRELQSQP